MTTTHHNRNSMKASVHHGFYCWGCDAAIVLPDKKCHICGTRNISSRKRHFSISTLKRIKEE